MRNSGLHNLPRGWAEARIGELVGPDGVFVDGDWVESKDQDPQGDIRLIQLADIGDGVFRDKSARFLTREKALELGCTFLKSGDVLIARMPDPLGRACIFPGDSKDSVTAVDVCIVRTGVLGANHRWLVWATNSPQFRNLIAGLQSGSTRKRISRGNLATLHLPVPPKAEQERVAQEIEKQFTRLEAAIAALKRVQANLKRYRAAVLKAVVEGRLVPTEAELARAEGRSYEPASELLKRILAERRARWEADQLAKFRASSKEPKDDRWKAKYEEPKEPDTTGLPALPEGWAWAVMPQLGELNRGKSKHRPRGDARLFGGPYPFIQTGDVKRSGGYIRNHSQTYNETGLAQSRLWPPGTLCITIAANIAESGILTYPACFPDSVVGFGMQGYPETVRFVQCFLDTAKAELSRFAPATAQKNINLETLSGLGIPLPPFAEQHRIVAEVERRLSVIDELEMQVETNLKRAERLRQAILKRAFEGKLVPQDPDDEPASVLLERTRAERQTRTGKSACATGVAQPLLAVQTKKSKKRTGKSFCASEP